MNPLTISEFLSEWARMIFSAAALREIRTQADLSQSQLAALAGCHVTSVSDWERGATVPTVRSLIRLASALNISVDSLLGAGETVES